MVVPLSSSFSGLTVQFSVRPCYSRKSHNKGAKAHLLLSLSRKRQENVQRSTFLVALQQLMAFILHAWVSNDSRRAPVLPTEQSRTEQLHPSKEKWESGTSSDVAPPAKCTISLLSVTLHVPTKESWCTARVNGRPRGGVLCTRRCVSWVNTASNGKAASSIPRGATHAAQNLTRETNLHVHHVHRSCVLQ